MPACLLLPGPFDQTSAQFRAQSCNPHGLILLSKPGPILLSAPALVEVPATVVTRPLAFSPGEVEIRLPNRVELSVSVGTNSGWVGELLRELLTCSG